MQGNEIVVIEDVAVAGRLGRHNEIARSSYIQIVSKMGAELNGGRADILFLHISV